MPKPPYRFIHTPDGVRLRYNCWRCNSGQGRGTVLVLGGRAEFMEKYIETIQEITHRGFDAFSFDWRGQGGSERILGNSTKGYVQSYNDYLSDLKQGIDEVAALNCPKPWYILGHSMGAHIALHYLGQCDHDIAAAILVSPMVNINTSPMPQSFLQRLSRWMVQVGRQAVVLPSMHHRNALNNSFRRNRLTSDPVRFQHVQQLLRKHPELGVDGVTFGWLAATFDAIETLHSTGYAQQADLPILLVLAGNDQVVQNAATRNLSGTLPNKELVVIHEAKHEILQERDRIRLQFWRAFDQFVDGAAEGSDAIEP